MGDHPSRGSYSRRVNTRGGHQWHPEQFLSSHQHPHEPDDKVPDYQDFSLFSAFSSDRFGGILGNHDHSGHSSSSGLLESEIGDAEDRLSSLDGGTKLLRSPGMSYEDTGAVRRGNWSISETDFKNLLDKNARLEEDVQNLHETVNNMAQAMERLQFEHCSIMQQLHQSWQFMHMQLYGQSGCFPHIGSQTGETVSSQTSDICSEDRPGNVKGSTDNNAEEIKKLKERLCTIEGRHKTVQGKVSQLDKIYGPTSAAWGKHIKALLQDEEGKGMTSYCKRSDSDGSVRDDGNPNNDTEDNGQK